MSNHNYSQLFEYILERSESDVWAVASKEWYQYDGITDESMSRSCICGQPNLKYQFTIKNKHNGKEIFPIGSECIKQFQDDTLTKSVQTWLGVQKLVEHIRSGEDIEHNSKLFTRNVMKFLYEDGAFKPNSKNGGLSEDALYEIFLKARMSPKSVSDKQIWRAKQVLRDNIIPYCLD